MKGLQNTNPWSATSSLRPRFITLVVVSLLLTFAFVLSGYSGKLLPSANAASITHTSASSNSASYPIKVFFSKSPESLNTNPSAVYPVDRVSPTIAVGTFSLQLLIAGPTLSERNAGYFTELNTLLSGPSNCSAPLPVGGPDFTLTLNMKGSVPETGTATVKFCRTISSPGIGADARVTAEINATLKQFSNIKKVVILTKDGHCFGDGSGKDLCLH
ncbi:MAG: hypothetical protein ACJ8DI_17240 [Ktedonobacteraceae bacterium]